MQIYPLSTSIYIHILGYSGSAVCHGRPPCLSIMAIGIELEVKKASTTRSMIFRNGVMKIAPVE